MAPSFFKRVYEIEKIESDSVSGLRYLAGLRFNGQVRESLKRHKIFRKYTA